MKDKVETELEKKVISKNSIHVPTKTSFHP